MSIFQALTAKPWLAEQQRADNLYLSRASGADLRRFALQIFICVVAVLFTLLIIAYGGRMAYEDWRPVPQMRLLWANTAVLLLGSIALQWAHWAAGRGKTDALRFGLLAGGAFTLVFLFGQVLAWRQLASMIFFDITNPAIGFFYLITGLHALHLLGGMVAWGRTVRRVWGNCDLPSVRRSVELCTVYWHFLLLLWLLLFGLLFTGNNFELFLKFCGLR